MDDDCPECTKRYDEGYEEPCKNCRKEIHESWHKMGMWWIRMEECSENCPGNKDKK